MRIVVAADPETLADQVVGAFEAACDQSVSIRGRFAAALTGGHSVGPFYSRLVRASVEWSRVVLLQAHDRPVPLYEEASGRGITHRMLLGHLELPASDDDLTAALGTERRLDFVQLGLTDRGRLEAPTSVVALRPRKVFFLVTGKDAAEAVREAINDPGSLACQLAARGTDVVWMLDRDSASKL